MDLLIDTCVFRRCHMEEAEIYRSHFGSTFGFEILPMFDLPDFEENFRKNIRLFQDCPLFFHEPVWGVEHTAPAGSPAYQESMHHILLTRKFTDILKPSHMVYHLNNCSVSETEKERMLQTSLDNLEEMRSVFRDVSLLVENTGTAAAGDLLLDQCEFTALCLEQDLEVLIDVGHANANGWDLFRLITDLRNHIRGFHFHNNDGALDLHSRISDGTLDFSRLMPFIRRTVPEATWVIEYTNPDHGGAALIRDMEIMMRYQKADLSADRQNEAAQWKKE